MTVLLHKNHLNANLIMASKNFSTMSMCTSILSVSFRFNASQNKKKKHKSKSDQNRQFKFDNPQLNASF